VHNILIFQKSRSTYNQFLLLRKCGDLLVTFENYDVRYPKQIFRTASLSWVRSIIQLSAKERLQLQTTNKCLWVSIQSENIFKL